MLALVVHLVALAMLFLLLHAEFVAAAQVVVYAGAVMVLYVFVAAYVGDEGETWTSGGRLQRSLALLLAGALAVELLIALLGTGLRSLADADELPTLQAGFGGAAEIGELLLTRYLLAFEAARFCCWPLPLVLCCLRAVDPAACRKARAWWPSPISSRRRYRLDDGGHPRHARRPRDGGRSSGRAARG